MTTDTHIVLNVSETGMPALLAALRCFVDAERAENGKRRSLAFANGPEAGLADAAERIYRDFLRQRDEHYAARAGAEIAVQDEYYERMQDYYQRMMDDDEAAREDAAESDR